MIEIKVSTKIDGQFEGLINELYTNELHRGSKSCQSDGTQKYVLNAMSGNKIIGRLVIFENPDLLYNDEQVWTFGMYEAYDDNQIALALFSAATKLAKDQNIKQLVGPMNGSTWYNYRQPMTNDKLFFTEEASMVYYANHFISSGFREIATYFSSIDIDLNNKRNVTNTENKLIQYGLSIRSINLEYFEEELNNLYAFTSLAFDNNFLYTPIKKSEFIYKYKSLSKYIDPTYFLIAEDINKEMVGFILGLPDYYNTAQKSIILKTLARHPDSKWAGLGSLLSEKIMEIIRGQQVESVVHAFMHENNNSIHISNSYGNHFKKYKLYAKEI